MGNCCNAKDYARVKGYDEVEDCETNQAILDCFINQAKRESWSKETPAALKIIREIPKEYLRLFWI